MIVKKVRDYDQLSSQIGEIVVNIVKEKPNCMLCLAGGDTPIGVFRYLVDQSNNGVDFSHCNFIGLDEWVGMDKSDPGSCQYLLYNELFIPMKIDDSQIHFFNARSENLYQECQKIDEFIEERGGIDFALLGVGLNGHLGFNEPGISFENHSHVVELDEVTKVVGQKYFNDQQPLTKGITLGIQNIMDSKQVIMMASGNKKQNIIEKILTNKVTNEIPSTILREHHNSAIYVDEQAYPNHISL